MTKNALGLYDITVGREKVFSDLSFHEGLSALMFCGAYYEGVCFLDGTEIARFNQ